MMRVALPALVLAGLTAAWPTTASAQTFRPTIGSSSPVGIQRGREFDWTVSGIWIGTGTAVHAGHAGIKVLSVQPTPTPDGAKNPDGTLKARVFVDASVPPGRYPMRVVTRAGLSDPAYLVVGVWPEVAEVEPNQAGQPQRVVGPATIVAALGAAEDVDSFVVGMRRGEHLVVDTMAGGLGSPLVPIVVIKDSQGREVGSAMGLRSGDASVAIPVRADGDYTVQIRDLSFRGGGEYRYRMNVGALPWATSVYPPGGTAGSNVEAELSGVNMPAGLKVTLPVPSIASDDPLAVALPMGANATNPVRIGVSTLTEVREVESNNTVQTAQSVTFPVVVNGRLDKGLRREGDEDWYQLKVPAGTVLALEVEGARLGSGVDPVLSVHDEKGNRLASADDARGSDPVLTWAAPAAGSYRIRVADLHGRSAPSMVYRLRVEPVAPDFRISFIPDAVCVPAGGRVPVTVQLERRGGYSGPIDLAWSGLPAGIRVLGSTNIAAGVNQTALVLEGDSGASGGGLVNLEGIATIDGAIVRHGARSLAETASKNGEQLVIASSQMPLPGVGLAGVPDVVVEAGVERITVAPSASFELPFQLRRTAGFAAKVTMVLRGLPPGVGGELAVAENAVDGKMVLKAEGSAVPGTYQIALVARVYRDELRWTEQASKPIVLEIRR